MNFDERTKVIANTLRQGEQNTAYIRSVTDSPCGQPAQIQASPKPVLSELDVMDKNINILEVAVQRLTDALGVVLGPDFKPNEVGGPSSAPTPQRSQLMDLMVVFNQRLSAQTGLIDQLIKRLEI